jgi:rsbT co-antagonist protein RsbR
MWSNLRLRGRILLSYTILLLVMLLFASYSIFQLSSFIERITNLDRDVEAVVRINTTLAKAIGDIQRSVGIYRSNPTDQQAEQVREHIRALSSQISTARRELPDSVDRQRLIDLNVLVSEYEQDFQTLVSLIDRQAAAETEIREALLTNGAVISIRITDATRAIQIEREIQFASLWVPERGDLGIVRPAAAAAALRRAADEVDRLIPTIATPVNQSDLRKASALLRETAIAIQSYENNRQLTLRYEERIQTKNDNLEQEADNLLQEATRMMSESTIALTQQSTRTQQITGATLFLLVLTALGLGFLLAQTITRPLNMVVDEISSFRETGTITQMLNNDRSEIGKLNQAFRQMALELIEERKEVQRQQQALSDRNIALEHALDEANRATTARDAMAATVRALSVPILPIQQHVLLVPLVGEIDHHRANTLLERVLQGVMAHQANLLILDVTGVPLIDSFVADAILRTVQAARLLGCRCTLVGLTPEVAQTLIGSGIDLSQIITQADLRTAIANIPRAAALRQR